MVSIWRPIQDLDLDAYLDRLLGRLCRRVQGVRRHAHVVEDVGELTGIDSAIVGNVLYAPLMHIVVAC